MKYIPTTIVIILATALAANTAGAGVEKPVVIAHRGASAYVVEHTLPAKAMAHAMGADYIEQDVVLSKDGVLVVLHDIYLNATTNVAERFPGRQREDGRFYAFDFTLAELKQLEKIERINPRTGKQVYPNRFPVGKGLFQIATLEEELRLIQGLNKSSGREAGVYVEIKSPAWHRRQGADISRATVEMLRRFGYSAKTDKCWIQIFEWEEVQRVRGELGWKGRLLLLTGSRGHPDLAEVAKVADGIGPELNQIATGKTPADRKLTPFSRQARALGLAIHPYTARHDDLPPWAATADDLYAVLFREAKVDGVFTDFPDLTRRWIDRNSD